MKNIKKLSAILMIIVILMSGCSTKDANADNSGGIRSSMITFDAEIISVNNSLLIIPDKNSNEFKSSDKISVNIQNAKIKNIKNKKMKKSDLRRGETVRITYNGTILESYPAQITADSIQVIKDNKLIEGYLALIDDIYKIDTGLNGDIKMIALDTTEWIGLSKTEKDLLFTILKETYGFTIIEGTFDELAKKGLIKKKELYFPDGILITISKMKYNKVFDTITCSINKWRSGLGAVGSDKVTAKFKKNVWKVTKKGMWIS